MNVPTLPNLTDTFAQAIAATGMHPPDEIHADGALHRFSPSGRRGDLAAWYVLHADGVPAGVFGDWRSGLVQTWCAKPDTALTAAEREQMRERVRQAKAQRDAEQARRHQDAAAQALRMWQDATPASANHPYLAAKGVQPHGLRMDADAHGLLLVPAYADGELCSLQSIAPDGAKRFLPGGRLRGAYCPMGKLPTSEMNVLVVAEGWATSASIHEATNYPVAAAFSAGNLLPVAQALHRKYPKAALVLAADDDWRTDGNPGMSAARAAALAVGGLVVVPHFPAARDGATDFNDLHQLAGLGAVRACFAEVLEGMPHAKP